MKEIVLKLLNSVESGDLIAIAQLFETSSQEAMRLFKDPGTWKPSPTNENGNTPFHLACTKNQVAVLEILTAKLGKDLLEAKNNAQMAPIHEATINNSLEAAKFLLKLLGPDDLLTMKGGFYGHAPLHMAACNGHCDMVRLFLENGAKMDEENGTSDEEYKSKPIHLATYYGRLGVVRLLLERGPQQLDERDNRGNHLIHWAAVGGQVEMVKFFVEKCGVDMDIKQNNSQLFNTALHCSVAGGRREVVAFLVEKGANLDAKNANGAKPIHLAAIFNQAEIAQILLDAKPAHLNKEPILHFAALGGSAKVVEVLLKRGADVASTYQGNYSPLHFAAISGSPQVVDILAKNGALNARIDASLPPPLHLAAFYGKLGVLKRFLELKPQLIDEKDSQGNFLIHWVALGGRCHILKWLICDQNCDIERANDRYGYRAIHCASLAGHFECVALLIKLGAVIASKRDCDGKMALHCAATNGHLTLVEFFIKLDAALMDVRDKNGYLPLHLATLNGHLDCVASLLNNNKRGDLMVDERGGKFGRTPLQMAADKGHLEVVTYLVETKGANILATSNHGDMAIHLAAKRGYANIVDFFLGKHYGDLLIIKPGHQAMLPFHLGVYFGYQSIAEVCIRHQAGVDQLDTQRRTPLHYAALGGRFEMVKFLISQGASLMAQSGSVDQRRLPVHLATLHGHLKVVELLINERPDSVMALDSEGNGLLFYAVRSGNVNVVRFLLSKNAKVELQNVAGLTALHLAAELGHISIVDALIKAGANLEVRASKEGYFAPIHLAAYNGQVEVVEFMLKLKPKLLDIEDGRGNKAVHLAALGGRMQVVECLLLRHRDVEVRDSHFGRTPLHCAAERGHVDLIDMLIRRFGANVGAKSSDEDASMTPLHLASWYGNLEAVQRLVTVDNKLIMVKDGRGLTPLQIAKHRDNPDQQHHQVIKWLKKAEPRKYYV